MTFGNKYTKQRHIKRIAGVKQIYLEGLDNILEKARMSPMLKVAVKAIRDAVEAGNIELVADLSAVKSYITPVLNSNNKDPFQEDNKYNKKKFGESLYSYLGDLHFDYALASGTLPSGMVIYAAEGVEERSKPKIEHPILKLMMEESKRYEKEREAFNRHYDEKQKTKRLKA